jgi:hypothetical protein
VSVTRLAATEESLRKILKDFSEGEAGTIVRFPSANDTQLGGTKPLEDGTEESYTKVLAKAAKKARKEAERAISSALRVGSDNTPRTWVALHHPNTDDAARGEVRGSTHYRLPPALFCVCFDGSGRTPPRENPFANDTH